MVKGRSYLARRGLIAILAVLCGFGVERCAGAIPSALQQKLDAARERLHVSIASRRAIEQELESLKAAGDDVPPETLQTYEAYLRRMTVLVERQQAILEEMEALARPYKAAEEKSGVPATEEDSDPSLMPVVPPSVDESAALERAFNDSLSEFDALIMEKIDELAKQMEQAGASASEENSELASAIEAVKQRLAQRQAASGGQQGQQSASGTVSGGQQGQTGTGQQAGQQGGGMDGGGLAAGERQASGQGTDGTGESGESGEAGEQGQQGEQMAGAGDQGEGEGREGAGEGTRPGGELASAERTGTGAAGPVAAGTTSGGPQHGEVGQGGSGAPGGGIGPEREAGTYAEDDDIIARQLREAAENETDPVLKEKLWKEYRKYKESQTR